MTPCQHCDGTGQVHVLACSMVQGCQFRVVACFRCEGTGQLTEAQRALHAQGERLKHWRITHEVSQREAAKRLGLASPALYSDLEWGRRGVTLAQQQDALARLMEDEHQPGDTPLRPRHELPF